MKAITIFKPVKDLLKCYQKLNNSKILIIKLKCYTSGAISIDVIDVTEVTCRHWSRQRAVCVFGQCKPEQGECQIPQ